MIIALSVGPGPQLFSYNGNFTMFSISCTIKKINSYAYYSKTSRSNRNDKDHEKKDSDC